MDRLGDLDLIARVGGGASSEVWRARRRSGLGQVVAVKRLQGAASTEQRDRLRAEAAVLQDLDHPHIVRVLDVVADGDGVAVVMAFAPGGTLADLLAERGSLPPGEVVALLAPVADALASAHRRQVVHGDVKPANVLFTADGEPLLSDFGTAMVLRAGGVEATPEYAAPEVLAGRGTGPPADVWSLAATGVEALTGAVPAAGLLDQVGGQAGALADLLAAGLDPDPAGRPSAADLAAGLRRAVPASTLRLPGPATAGQAAGPSTRTFGPQPTRDRPSPARRARPWLLGAAAVLAVGTLWVVSRDDGGPDCPTVEVASQPGAQVAEGDFDGDGCPSGAAFTPDGPGGRGVLRVDLGEGEPFEVAVGGPGDELHVGDWDCDGLDRPALHRPADGTVVYLEELELGAAATAEPLAEPGQAVEVEVDDEGCDALVPVR